jgi:ABC-type branched-subunit amino acid transport system substrate-binding protein
MVEAFTGPNSIDGIAAAAGCYPAALVVNQSGGVLGHKIQCVPVDTRGDPRTPFRLLRSSLPRQAAW